MVRPTTIAPTSVMRIGRFGISGILSEETGNHLSFAISHLSFGRREISLKAGTQLEQVRKGGKGHKACCLYDPSAPANLIGHSLLKVPM